MNIFATITPAIKNAVQVLINNNKNLKLKAGNTLDKEVKYLLLTDKGEYGWFCSHYFEIYGPVKEVCEEEIITKILSFKPQPPKLVTFKKGLQQIPNIVASVSSKSVKIIRGKV